MYLIQLLLPLSDNDGVAFTRAEYDRVVKELTEAFSGVTTHVRAPARGLWQEEEGGPVVRDDVVIFEVMAKQLDRGWWKTYRGELEKRFRQEVLIIRASPVELL